MAKSKLIVLVASLFVVVLPCLLLAADGGLDTSFNRPNGYVLYNGWNRDSYVGAAVQSDGKILVSSGINGASDTDAVVLRYTGSGNPDADFGTNGVATYDGGSGDDCARLLALQADSKIVVTGYTQNGTVANVLTMRYNSDGTLDSTFGTNGVVTYDSGGRDDYGRSVGIQADGKILVAARSTGASTSVAVILRYNEDGTLDPAFGTNGIVTYEGGYGNDGFRELVIQTNGRIVVSGYTLTEKDFDVLTARYNADGTLDNTFGTNGVATYDGGHGDDGARGVAIQTDGKIVVSGGIDNGTDQDILVLRYDSNGSPDNTFGTNGVAVYDSGRGNDYGRRLAIQKGNRVIVTGRSYSGSDYDVLALRYNAYGTLDYSFGAYGVVVLNIGEGNDYGEGVAIQADHNIVISGGTYNGTDYEIMVLRLLGLGSGGGTGGGCFIKTAAHGF
ncbi:MAG: hypothetical protein JRL30_23290 [Deltaproteobacteria bacterium]|nr:hypothetical protein [Deltaproteobacteria bacterium]